MYRSAVLVYSQNYMAITALIPEHFYHSKSNPVSTDNHLPSPWQPLIHFLSLQIYMFQTFHIDGIMQYMAVSASFPQHGIFKIPPCCVSQYFILFYSWILLHCRDISHFAFTVISWWTFGLFPQFPFCWIDTPRGGIAGSYGKSV